jgi:hypothetical protein
MHVQKPLEEVAVNTRAPAALAAATAEMALCSDSTGIYRAFSSPLAT